ncbi:HalOD1 output domain-containing protein [Halorientalis pallida]|uniref:HalOD1 output domain-containing protein n=1 Tax=Halorientalis pallida TaxID=2479928 RepID=UPI003C6F8446
MFRTNHSPPDDRPAHERDTFTAQFDPAGERAPSAAVIDSVATVTGSDPATISPLFEVVDPDALDRLFDTERDGGERDGPLTVSFRYEGCAVTVHADGRIVVAEPSHDQR